MSAPRDTFTNSAAGCCDTTEAFALGDSIYLGTSFGTNWVDVKWIGYRGGPPPPWWETAPWGSILFVTFAIVILGALLVNKARQTYDATTSPLADPDEVIGG